MHPPVRLIALILGVFALLLSSPSAVAHEDHLGTWDPSPESETQNVKILGSAPKTSTVPSYRNSDLAFWGKTAIAGNYEGFRTIDVSDPAEPTVISDFACAGSQHDVSVWKGLLFTSIDSPLTAPECGSPRSLDAEGHTAPGFEGIRIFDIRDPANPVYKGAVATDCGSHTHTLVPDAANPGRVLLYVASYPSGALAPSAYGNSCSQLNPDGSQGHSKISVVSVPLDNPAAASVVSEPVFELNDRGGTPGFRGCHDISVFMEIERAASACMSEGQIWDISDLEHPRTIARVHNPAVDFFHSATFTWDGSTVLFGDEAGGGVSPRCRTTDASTVGAIWLYDVASLDSLDAATPELPLSHFKIPRVQGDKARCTMHNFNVLPIDGRYVGVSAAYSGGTTVFDFTDRTAPREVGHNDPHGANTWSSYWYNGHVYTNDTGRGLDVMLLSDSARAGAQKLPYLNPQTQEALIG
ncbi:MAG: LVIVD repeat-containing protein [Actinomycetes bacterium]